MSLQPRFLEIEFGPLKIKFYALTILQLQEMDEEMQALRQVANKENPFDPERFKKLLRLYTASAQRGNPNVTSDQVGSVIDLSNIAAINRAVLGQSDVTDGASGPTSPQIGGESTQKS